MSVVRSQPSPYGYLQRERHIEPRTRVPKDRTMCRCMELLQRQPSLQQDDDLRSSDKIKEKITEEEESPKISSAANSVKTSRKAGSQITCTPSLLATSSQVRSTNTDPRVQRALTAVEELDESSFPELQIFVGAQQFCITSKAKPQGLSCQSKKLYIVSSRTAKQLLVAVEESSCLCLQLCGPARSCCLRLCDQRREEVLRFCRPYRVDVCCLFCCLMAIRVFSSANNLLGFVQQRWSLFSPSLSVYNSEGRRMMDIQGSWSAARCHSDQEFQVTSLDGELVAIIWKRWPGFNEDYNMDHDFFGLDISAALSPSDKALLLAATFLLNYMFFEMS
ncbi:phospholipid scramblase family member 5-like isoform X2 [Pseudophryne corroboree]|uniref:phospholipid scramblase family member 5-like isoform X2 n=1 Tax=Pseudophryne corroboree TaxID=495146 RepID=UPI0030813AA1